MCCSLLFLRSFTQPGWRSSWLASSCRSLNYSSYRNTFIVPPTRTLKVFMSTVMQRESSRRGFSIYVQFPHFLDLLSNLLLVYTSHQRVEVELDFSGNLWVRQARKAPCILLNFIHSRATQNSRSCQPTRIYVLFTFTHDSVVSLCSVLTLYNVLLSNPSFVSHP